MRHHHSQSGFTLIELLVVIIVVGILGAIALPSFLGQANRARTAEAELYLGTWLREQQVKYVELGEFSIEDVGTLETNLENYRVQVNTFSNHQTAAGVNVSGLRIRALPEQADLKQFMGKVWFDPTQNDLDTVLCDSTGTTAFMKSKTYCPD
ncbi:MAG: type IV pilin protein [Leptolyngbyaceae cyanobacterium]